MQNKVDTQGYIMKGLRAAARDIRACVKRKELYFLYIDMIDHMLYVNVPAGASPCMVLLVESGVYALDQQEIANLAAHAIEMKKAVDTLT